MRKSLSVNTENPHGSIIHHQSTNINDRRSWNASSSFSWLHRHVVTKSQDSGDDSWGDVNRLWRKQPDPDSSSDKPKNSLFTICNTCREPRFSSCPSHYTWSVSICEKAMLDWQHEIRATLRKLNPLWGEKLRTLNQRWQRKEDPGNRKEHQRNSNLEKRWLFYLML